MTHRSGVGFQVLQRPSDGMAPLRLIVSVCAILATQEAVITQIGELCFHSIIDLFQAALSAFHKAKAARG